MATREPRGTRIVCTACSLATSASAPASGAARHSRQLHMCTRYAHGIVHTLRTRGPAAFTEFARSPQADAGS